MTNGLLVDVSFDLYPNSARLRVTIHEALTEQEKHQREEENRQREEGIRQWEEETLRKSGFTAWNRDNDEFFQTWKTLEESYLEEIERLEQEEHVPYMSRMPHGMPWLMLDMERILRHNGVHIGPKSDTDEVMASLQNLVESDSTGIMKVMQQELLDLAQLDQNMEGNVLLEGVSQSLENRPRGELGSGISVMSD